VEFYKVENLRIKREEPGSAAKMLKNVPNLTAQFFGTDFNFLYSREMQEEFN
jgi:hypothetical protein